MKHYASPSFGAAYDALPEATQTVAKRSFQRLKSNPRHPGLRFKKVGLYWSVRAGLHNRALAIEVDDGLLWFWIGSHTEYDQLINS